MEDRLRIAVSGIRGKVPVSLNVDIASRFASAFASCLEKGSMAFMPVSPGYDALAALTLILQLLSREERPLSEVVEAFPELHRRKLKIPVSPVRVYELMDRLEDFYSSEQPDTTDGIRIDRGSLWFIIRPSSTEFILRIMIEGENEAEVDETENEIREKRDYYKWVYEHKYLVDKILTEKDHS
jgi:phosphomannomutase